MRLKKRVWIIVLCACICISLVGGVMYFTVPFTSPKLMAGGISLSRPESAIRRDMLIITPIGTSMDDVLKVIEERGWHLTYARKTAGYFLYSRALRDHVSDVATSRQLESGRSVEIGTQSIRIHLGRYRVILDIYVDVYFAFDDDSKLIDVAIRREMDVI